LKQLKSVAVLLSTFKKSMNIYKVTLLCKVLMIF